MERTVPLKYEGLWRRAGIRRSDGSVDLSTRVWWFQSPSFHIDVRIPADRPAVADAASLARLAPELRRRYARLCAFAGVTMVEGDRCSWHPALAFPAISPQLDAGRMRFDGPDRLHETGLDDSYEEDWVRIPTGPMHGVRLRQVDGDALAYLLVSEHWMAWAHGHGDERFVPEAPLADRLAEFSVLQKLEQWTIVASSLAWQECRTPLAGTTFDPAQVALWRPGELHAVPLAPDRRWRILDCTTLYQSDNN